MFLIVYGKDSFVDGNKIDEVFRSCDGSLWFSIGSKSKMVDDELEGEFLERVHSINDSTANPKIELGK